MEDSNRDRRASWWANRCRSARSRASRSLTFRSVSFCRDSMRSRRSPTVRVPVSGGIGSRLPGGGGLVFLGDTPGHDVQGGGQARQERGQGGGTYGPPHGGHVGAG